MDTVSTGQPAARSDGSLATHSLLHPRLHWNQASATATSISTDTAEALTGAFQTMNANTSFNLSHYVGLCATPKNIDAQ